MINNALLFLFYIHFNIQLEHVHSHREFFVRCVGSIGLVFLLNRVPGQFNCGQNFLALKFFRSFIFPFLKDSADSVVLWFLQANFPVVRVSHSSFLWQCINHVTQIWKCTLINENMGHPTLVCLALINVVCTFSGR